MSFFLILLISYDFLIDKWDMCKKKKKKKKKSQGGVIYVKETKTQSVGPG